MKRAIGIGFLALGSLFLLPVVLRGPSIIATIRHLDDLETSRAVGHLVGMFIPSFACFIVAALLWPKTAVQANRSDDNRRRIVTFTPRAAQLATTTIAAQGHASDTVLRIVRAKTPAVSYAVQYDIPSAADCDWTDDSCGIVVVVEKTLADELTGFTVDVRDGVYVVEKREPRMEADHADQSDVH